MIADMEEIKGTPASPEEIAKIESLHQQSRALEGSNPKVALSYAEQALDMSKKLSYEKGIAYSLLSKGIVCERLSDYSSGMTALIEALPLFRRLEDKTGEVRTLNTLGIYYFFLAKFQDSMDYFQASLSLAREIGFQLIEVRSLNNIGEIYRELGKFDEALIYYNASFSIVKNTGDNLTLGALLMNIGHLHYSLGHLKEASGSYKSSIRLFRETQEQLFEAESLNKLGQVYLDYGKYKNALECFQRSLAICRKQENKYLEVSVLQSLSKANINQKKYREALQDLEMALNLAQEIQADKILGDIHLSLAVLTEETEDYKTSVLHYKEYYKIMKEVTSDEFQKKLNAASIQFKLEQAQAEAEIFRLKNIDLKQKAEEIEAKASELENSYNNMHIVSEIGRNITSSLDLEDILNTLYESINSLMDARCFGVGLFDSSKGMIEYKFVIDKSVRLPVSYKPVTNEDSFAAWCIRSGKTVCCNDLTSEYHKYVSQITLEVPEKATNSVIYCPLTVKNEVIGVITVQSYEKGAYSTYNLDIIKALASYVAIALNNSAKSEEIKNKATLLAKEIAMRKHAQTSLEKSNLKLETLLSIDVLTGISNRRSFERFARKMWKHAESNSLPLSFLLIDIDFFKQYNDSYGHPKGDICLRKVSLCLQESIRKPLDFVARYGGEEFIVILPETDSDEAVNIAERLREKVEDLKIRHKNSIVSKFVTISIGIACVVPKKGINMKQLMICTDNALYQAKNTGRNCVRLMDVIQQKGQVIG